MSCSIVKKETSSTNVALDKLQKYFDEITLEEFEKYTQITFKDKANKPNYDWTVWLSYKVQKNDEKSSGYAHNYRDAEYYMQEVCTKVLDWVDCLKDSIKEDEPKQLSLFGEPEEDETEKLPPHPTNDGGWSKYNKECERIKKANKMKQYSFLELVNVEYYTYSDIDYRQKLPSLERVRELIKDAVINGMNNPGRYNDFWLDTPSYLTRDGGLSDYELIGRLTCTMRLFLLPYTSYPYVMSDDSFNGGMSDRRVSHRYYLDGTKLSTCSSHDNDKLDLPNYDGLYNLELVEWIRETMQIARKEVATDEEVLEENLINYFRLDHLDFDMKREVNSVKNWKTFRARFYDTIKENNYNVTGGGSGYRIDGYSGGYSDKGSKKGSISITQNLELRESLGRECEQLNDYNEVIVYDLKGDALFEKAFEIFNKKVVKQVSLLDLMAA